MLYDIRVREDRDAQEFIACLNTESGDLEARGASLGDALHALADEVELVGA